MIERATGRRARRRALPSGAEAARHRQACASPPSRGISRPTTIRAGSITGCWSGRGAGRLLLQRLLTGDLLPPSLLSAMLRPISRGRSDRWPSLEAPAYGLGLMIGETTGGELIAGHTGGGPGSAVAVYHRLDRLAGTAAAFEAGGTDDARRGYLRELAEGIDAVKVSRHRPDRRLGRSPRPRGHGGDRAAARVLREMQRGRICRSRARSPSSTRCIRCTRAASSAGATTTSRRRPPRDYGRTDRR